TEAHRKPKRRFLPKHPASLRWWLIPLSPARLRNSIATGSLDHHFLLLLHNRGTSVSKYLRMSRPRDFPWQAANSASQRPTLVVLLRADNWMFGRELPARVSKNWPRDRPCPR